jgi:hypothetical protein
MDNTTEMASLAAALKAIGANTETCQHCGAPEAGALRYKCGSYWRHEDGEPGIASTPLCQARALQNNSCEAIIKTLKHQGQYKFVRRVRVPATETSGTEEWKITVELVDVGDDRKSALNLVDP